MALPSAFAPLLSDPGPEHIFELSDAGIAHAIPSASQIDFHPLEPGIIAASPLTDNVLRPDALTAALRRIVGSAGRKRSRAVLILPDYSARVAILEFDSFPSDPREQLTLLRFRMKKSVPFDVESAALSFHAQPTRGADKKIAVVVVAASLEIVGRYEAPFREAGLHPGIVTTSVIPMSDLCTAPGVSVAARLNGKALTVAIYDNGMLRLVRCVELQEDTTEEIVSVLFPTVAFAEDEIGSHPDRLLLCGFGHHLQTWGEQLGVPAELLRSRFGVPAPHNAGLLGYLETVAAAKGPKVA